MNLRVVVALAVEFFLVTLYLLHCSGLHIANTAKSVMRKFDVGGRHAKPKLSIHYR